MELKHAHQVPFNELLNETIDIVIAACGYESRSSHLVQLSNFNAKRKIAFLFNEEKDCNIHKQNQLIYQEKGFECYFLNSNGIDEITELLENICSNASCDNIKLIVDYSSMTKLWYGTIIKYFAFNDLEFNNLVVYFCYTPEHFLPPTIRKGKLADPQPVLSNGPSMNQNKPLALIIGLGYDEAKIEFLCDFFKPHDVFFFLPNPSFDAQCTILIQKSNKSVLANAKPSHLMHYAENNIEDIDSKLTSLCLSLRLKYRTIMVSLGPKTFSLANFLLNARYPDVEIWNMSGNEQSIDLKAAGVPIVYKAILTNIDEDY